MTKPLILIAMCAVSVHAQVIQIAPTNYSQTIRSQNNLGRVWSSWQDSTRDTITLGKRVLTFSHTVLCDGVYFYGTKGGGPKLLEDRFSYRQIGGASYVPAGGEEITYFAQKSSGAWIASTNVVAAVDMAPVFWLPEFTGTATIGDRWQRTITTASALECHGRNLQNTPYLLRVRCAGGGVECELLFRFEADQRKPFFIGTGPAGVGHLTFDLDDCIEEAIR